MPELPEVETVVRTLEHQIKDLEITDVQVRYPKMIEGNVQDFQTKLIGQHFRVFQRRGKYLLFYLDTILLVSHLRMEGKFFLQNPSDAISKHVHVIVSLSNGKELRYHDTRKFGRMELLPKDTNLMTFHDLGPEPFSNQFNASYLYQMIHHKQIAIKTLLLDQHIVAGIGNIYADEILFASQIRPGRSCKYVTKKDCENIVQQTRRILTLAIKAGGTTIRSYTSSLGVTGRFQLSCNVHEQKVCRICNSNIKVKWIGGRSSYYCPVCQSR